MIVYEVVTRYSIPCEAGEEEVARQRALEGFNTLEMRASITENTAGVKIELVSYQEIKQ